MKKVMTRVLRDSFASGRTRTTPAFVFARRTFPATLPVTLAAMLATGTVLCLASGGCGGHNGSSLSGTPINSTTGRAVVTIHWPSQAASASRAAGALGTRLVPEATNLIQINIYRTVNGQPALVSSQQALRPAGTATSTVEIDNLPIDTLTVVAAAYPGTDSSSLGTALAQGSAPLVTQAGVSTPFSLTMATTIDHIDLAPASPTLPLATTLPLTATAYDGPDEATASVVMLSPDQLQWSSSDTTLATVDGSGSVTAVAGGHPIVRVKDAESNKTASTTLTIPLILTVSPAAPVVSVTYSTTLTATVAGTGNQGVTWSVVESNGGSISASGVYTAPATPTPTTPAAQPYHIIATSVADPTYSVTIPVIVQAGSASGTIN